MKFDWVRSPEVLQRLLFQQGHTCKAPCEPGRFATDICPSAETIVTVAHDCDATLEPMYRERYFVMVTDDNDEPLIQHAQEFALAELFASGSNRDPVGSFFTRGPVRWLVPP